MKSKIIIFILLLQAIFWVACIHKEEPNSAKPQGYFRISTPKPDYIVWDSVLPFTFQYNKMAQFSIVKKVENNYWMDLYYPQYNASLKMTMITLENNLREHVVNEEKMLMFHVEKRKADDIEYSIINAPQEKIFGQLYEIVGKEAATPLKFWITDSANYYVRATLYFNFVPNNDSLEPVIKYLKSDVMKMIDTWKWKK
jgi:gliding motility-associated lipoprotein GldD